MDELGALVGLDGETLRRNLVKGAPKPPKTARGIEGWMKRYHAWRREHVGTYQQEQAQIAKSARDEEEQGHKRDYQKWRAAEKRLQVAKQTRQLVEREEVVEMATRALLVFKNRLNGMVQKMTARLENQPAHVVHEELQTEVDDILNGFADGIERTHAR